MTLVKNGPQAIKWLLSQGVEFDGNHKELNLSMESGHSKRRIVHRGDYTGREIEESLVASVRRKQIEVYENCFALDLIIKDMQAHGVLALNLEKGKMIVFLSKVTILATGGVGQVYSYTSNPTIATGDGIAIAYRAGAILDNMEFIQFHPTTLLSNGEHNFLISETVRGEGGILRNASGDAFMEKYDKDRELAPRDIVSRAVFEELKKDHVYLDLRHMEHDFIIKRFPMIYQEALQRGIDITKTLIPISPAAHYLCGGIKVNLQGESNIRGLFAFGECASTGVHGANRLASNSLLESVVFTLCGVVQASSYLQNNFLSSVPSKKLELTKDNILRDKIKLELQNLMWSNVGIVRNETDLKSAIAILENLQKDLQRLDTHHVYFNFLELRNMITVSKLISKAAYIRTESRGTHYRADYPKQDDEKWLKQIRFQNETVKIQNIPHNTDL